MSKESIKGFFGILLLVVFIGLLSVNKFRYDANGWTYIGGAGIPDKKPDDINDKRYAYTCREHGGSYYHELKSGIVTCNDGTTFKIETVIQDPKYWANQKEK